VRTTVIPIAGCFPYRKYYFMWVDESLLAVAW